jgi:hypothetical protein
MFKQPGQEPVDPRYARFRDGWSKYIIGKAQYLGLRWSPSEKQGEWLEYKLALFDYLDFGLSGPDSPLEARWQFTNPPTYRYDWKLGQDRLPELWAQIEATYARVRDQHPQAVWNPYDGSWREVRRKSPGGKGPTPPAPPPQPLDPDLRKRLSDLHQAYRDRLITDEVLKQRTLELLREYG